MQRIPQVFRIIGFAAALVFVGKLVYVVDPFNLMLGREYYEARRGHVDLLCEYVNKIQYDCLSEGKRDAERGCYYVCDDQKFWPPARDNEKNTPCLIYSYTFNEDTTFENGLAEDGCEVHVFNPSGNRYEGWVTKSGVTLHRMGILNRDVDRNEKGWKMRKLGSTMKALGNEGKIITLFKINVSSTDVALEEAAMDHIFEAGFHRCITQYHAEIHMPGPMTNEENFRRSKRLFNRFMKLRTEGYRIYHTSQIASAVPASSNGRSLQEDIIRNRVTIRWQINFVNQNVAATCNDSVLRAG